MNLAILRDVAHTAFSLAGVVALSAITYRVLTFPPVPDLRPTLEAINRPCNTGKPCGTLADVNQTLATIRGAVGQVEVAARHENKQLGTLDAQELQIYTEVLAGTRKAQGTLSALNGTVIEATALMDEAKTTLVEAQPVITNLAALGDSSTTLVNSVNARVNSPDVSTIVSNFAGMSTSGGAMMADAQWKTHELLHPDKKRLTFGAAVWGTMLKIHQMLPPIF